MNQAPRPRGRPLDRKCDERILEATLDLLDQDGFDRFRMQDVAERAGVGFGTIYRRWPTKDGLILDALRSVIADVAEEDMRDLDGLERQFREMVGVMNAKHPDLFPGLVSAIQRNRELAEAFRRSWSEPLMQALETTIRAVAGPEVDDDVIHLMAELGTGLLFLRLFITDEPADGRVTRQIVDDILVPLVKFHAPNASLEDRGSRVRKARRKAG
jgi:AcrR family transcriptional regulator